jgi:hypothetical protein
MSDAILQASRRIVTGPPNGRIVRWSSRNETSGLTSSVPESVSSDLQVRRLVSHRGPPRRYVIFLKSKVDGILDPSSSISNDSLPWPPIGLLRFL